MIIQNNYSRQFAKYLFLYKMISYNINVAKLNFPAKFMMTYLDECIFFDISITNINRSGIVSMPNYVKMISLTHYERKIYYFYPTFHNVNKLMLNE